MRTKLLIIGIIIVLIYGCKTTEVISIPDKKAVDTDAEIDRVLRDYRENPERILEELNILIGDKKVQYSTLYSTVYISAGQYKIAKSILLEDPDYNKSEKKLKLLVISKIALGESYDKELQRILEINGNNIFALNKKAELLMEANNLDKAEEFLTKSYRADHKNSKTLTLLGDLALKRVDNLGLNKKRVLSLREEANINSYYNLALDYYKLVKSSSDSSYYVKLANVFKKLGRKLEAVRALDMAVEYDPDNLWNYYDRGKIYFYMGENHLALPDFVKAHSMDQDHFFTNIFLGRIFFSQNRIEESRAHYNMALRINPDYYPAFRDLSVLSYIAGDIELSLEYQIKLYYKESKRDQFIPLFLINTLYELDRDEDAKKILQKLVKYEKNSTMKGIYNYYLNSARTGAEVLSSALATDDTYFKTRLSYYISRALYREGVLGHSQIMLEEVAESDIDFESKLARYKLGEISE